MKKIITILVLWMLTMYMAACAAATPSTTKTPSIIGTAIISETPLSMETVTTGPSVSAGNVDELIAMVNKYVTSGDITGQAENGLLAKLESINQKLMNGHIDPASNEMGAFVNEVHAQVGKKISEAAATALITKAQAVAAEFVASVPVTGGETVAHATSRPTDSTLGNKPTPLGTQVDHQAQWDALTAQVVQAVGLTAFNYDLYQLPANTSWEDTLAYYRTAVAAAGWGDAPSQMNEMSGEHYAVWSVTGSDGTTNYFIVARAEANDNTFTLNIFGSK
jgi:FIMAH domain-containing protein